MSRNGVHARVSPEGSLEILSNKEVNQLKDDGEGGLYHLFRQCALAVLNSGTISDDSKAIMETYQDFGLALLQQPRGIKIELHNAPPSAPAGSPRAPAGAAGRAGVWHSAMAVRPWSG